MKILLSKTKSLCFTLNRNWEAFDVHRNDESNQEQQNNQQNSSNDGLMQASSVLLGVEAQVI